MMTFAIPCLLFLPSAVAPGMVLGSSLAIVGSTLSLAERETKSAKGTSQTHSPKYEAISVKVGREASYMPLLAGAEKCVNQA